MRTWTLSSRLLDPSPLPRRMRQHVDHPIGRGAEDSDRRIGGGQAAPGSSRGARLLGDGREGHARTALGSNGRVSGRVVDSGGRPVPNARVRLAVGGARGGRVNRATTDRSGAFTLRGLRPRALLHGDRRTGRQTRSLTGRSDVRAPDTDVRITLARPTSTPDASNEAISAGQPGLRAMEPEEETEGRRRLVRRQRGRPPPGPDDPPPSTSRNGSRSGGGRPIPLREWERAGGGTSRGRRPPCAKSPARGLAAPVDGETHGTARDRRVPPFRRRRGEPLATGPRAEIGPAPTGRDGGSRPPRARMSPPIASLRNRPRSARPRRGVRPRAPSDPPPSPVPTRCRGHWRSRPGTVQPPPAPGGDPGVGEAPSPPKPEATDLAGGGLASRPAPGTLDRLGKRPKSDLRRRSPSGGDPLAPARRLQPHPSKREEEDVLPL